MREVSAAPEISVVIPCRGHGSELAGCLGGLQTQRPGRSIEIVVVTGPAEPSVAETVARVSLARLVRSETPLLAGEARNLGVKESRGSLIALIDADCVPDPD